MATKVYERFDVVAVEVVFENVINDLSLCLPETVPKLLHDYIES